MKLKLLLEPLYITTSNIPDIEIKGIKFKSDTIRKGDMFVAIKGFNEDGHNYIQDAILRGATVVVGEKEMDNISVPFFKVHDGREALGLLSSVFFNFPSSSHNMVGITGTNGKTTTSYMLHHILRTSRRSCTLISTVANYINGQESSSKATTPSSLELQEMLSISKDKYVVMEVSSHGLDQKRVEGIGFDFTVFTNLSHEHLDYHKDLDDYFNSKAKLFKKLTTKGESIVNSNCSWGKKLIKQLRNDGVPVFTYGSSAEDNLQLLSCTKDSLNKVRWLGEEWQFHLPIPGDYNVENALAAITVALRIGMDVPTIQKSFMTFSGVSGRFEVHKNNSNVTFVVDYAHTPDGLEKFLSAVVNYPHRKLIHIFGFRGKRDISKRIDMLNISTHFCDEIILTIDDLNCVALDSMISELNELAKIFRNSKITIINDRTKAIEYAWKNAKADDYVVITGKGHELYKEPFILPTKTDTETIKYLFKSQVIPITS
ncbi:UDP-N-acetylmuramoyl-L-alanyl-D-glutamate--2,6-diaminopimelate ligase [Bacillaceae bacterium CLA-AA-H227]|uniref:UDP-N-acetylmuramyl-tripeptide synthetase n=2 Tax=Robertmurraya TaxID=2837507 RepID=A0A4U1CYL7_9BACI|nr:UDP-N-acetylmuramoyl-L-alanyl-D-glutamate--2,6-diaminopimelate ligase [Robertmurraya kyonggiensis]TKC15125.1 UDP-N-acetylmuramoyl-L-alanyl-D-glutamate--2,6-diaminopimelate ligase [Robertmurraya kyonggiensis]